MFLAARTTIRTVPRLLLSTRHRQQQQQQQPLSSIIPFILTADAGSAIKRTMASSAAAKRLQDKTVLITGASSGIGRSTAFEFARTAPSNGLKLILTARRADTLKQVAADIEKETSGGVKVLAVKLDVSSPEEVRAFVPGLPEGWGEIDVLVNNA